LERTREQLAELQALLDELPGIFERKFEQRLQPFVERQRQLAEENLALRERIQRVLAPAPAEPAASPGHQGTAGAGTGGEARGPSLPAVQRFNRLRAASRRLKGSDDRVA
jgi:hypothetical protein